ncbi:MAG TPA: hypothetical protein VHL09_16765 [Dehalococcoidia bacterium]|nr:hypothetical protein [Dehalococcoidia bacterium]
MTTCRVCAQTIADLDSGMTCYYCGQDFHFARTIQTSVADCGVYHFDADGIALVFMCASCVETIGLPDDA